jgi:hypothetical protein
MLPRIHPQHCDFEKTSQGTQPPSSLSNGAKWPNIKLAHMGILPVRTPAILAGHLAPVILRQDA